MISDADIRRAAPGNAFVAGLRLFQQGAVRSMQVHRQDGQTQAIEIDGRVKGSGTSLYRQDLVLTPNTRGGWHIGGTCTCYVGRGCKHIAALLINYNAQTKADIPTVPPPSAPSTLTPTLPPDVAAWLRSLDAAQQEDSEDYPPNIRKRLIYVLDVQADPWRRAPGTPAISLQSIEPKRDGTTQGATRHDLHQLTSPQAPKFLRPSDRAILSRIARAAPGDSAGLIAILRAITATGRGRWGTWTGPVLLDGPPMQAQVEWQLASDGTQTPTLALPPDQILLRLPDPWYANPIQGTIGPVETGLPPRLLLALLSSPALPPAIADQVRDELPRRVPDRPVPTPRPLAPPTRLHGPPQPHLLLLAGTLPGGPHDMPMARLSMRYGPVSLPTIPSYHRQPPLKVTVQQDGALFEVHRDRMLEDDAQSHIEALGFSRIPSYQMPPLHPNAHDMLLDDPDPAAWVEFLLSDLPDLRSAGWQIDSDPAFPIHLVQPDDGPGGGIQIEVQDTPGIDWFDLGLGVMVDGERINLVPALLDFIADTGADTLAGLAADDDDDLPLLLPLPDGRLLTISKAQIRPILAPLLELFAGGAADDGTLRLSRWNAADLALLEEASTAAGATWTGGESIRTLGRQLREHGGIPPVPTPAGFGAELRPYQAHGLAWLQFLRTAGLGGVLADDMGLGKTVQALAHLVVEQAEGRLDRPALVIGPTSLVPNWTAEAARFAPSLRVLVLHGPDRAERFPSIAEHDLVITTYPLLARDHEVLTAQDWHVVVLDEAQTIKNPQATTSKLARALQARQRLCLSGTPLENHLGELWSLFDFLLPGFLGTSKHFARHYRTPIEKAGNTERRATLAQRVAPFLLRRTKQQVAADLPPKTEIAEVVDMAAGQRALYDGIRLAMHAKVKQAVAERGLAKSGIIILDALLKLRQACCDPRLVKLATARKGRAASAKLDRLLELLPTMLEDGRRILLFSQFTSMLALIEAELTRLGLPYVLLTGDTKDRATPIRQFQAGQVPLFLISLKAGGVGLNLTAADTVIHYDPWWNPAVENQATDRAHRIGQDKPVFVHRLVTSGTIEEKMEVLKARKQALADGILGASAEIGATLTERDLDMLFEA